MRTVLAITLRDLAEILARVAQDVAGKSAAKGGESHERSL